MVDDCHSIKKDRTKDTPTTNPKKRVDSIPPKIKCIQRGSKTLNRLEDGL